MATYSLLFLPSVKKDLRRLEPATRARILARCDQLVQDPFPSQAQLLTGAAFTHRLRVGQYRVIYSVDTAKGEVVVRLIRHRKDAYRRG